MGKLTGKVAIITGAGGGQGAEEAKLFAKEGAKVIVTDMNEEGVNSVVAEIKAAGGEAVGYKHNVAEEDQWKQVIEAGIKEFGDIDILVNNAGILSMNPVTETSTEEFERIMKINATGNFFGMKYVIPSMQRKGAGSIVNISSLAAIYGVGGAGYNASKGATRALTKNTALAYGKDSIRVNSVHPGLIVTPMTEAAVQSEEAKKASLQNQVLPYFGKAADVANAVLFLASDDARFITGSELVIDGGALTM